MGVVEGKCCLSAFRLSCIFRLGKHPCLQVVVDNFGRSKVEST